MKVKQKNLRIFHINVENDEEFIAYFNKNRVILKEFFLLLEGEVSKKLGDFLKEEGVCYKDISSCNIRLGNVKKETPLVSGDEQKEEQKEQKEKKEECKEECKEELSAPLEMKVFNRPIRSGEEISETTSLSVFGRVNSGAKLFCTQNVSIYGVVDGLVQCDGEFMVLCGLGQRGNIIFNGEIIDNERIKEGVLQKLSKKGTSVEIKDIF